jgi:glycosyltransferase involved in cell wall biosynthesis
MNNINKIVFIHNLNDFSGSPKVLSIIISAMVGKYKIDLITSKGPGFLSNITDIKYIDNHYKWYSDSKIKTSIRLLFAQIFIFFRVLFYRNKQTLFYINTVVPFSAALACKITGKTMIYHIHENMNLDKPLYSLYRMVYNFTNKKNIFVSEYLKDITHWKRNCCIAYNSLDDHFLQERDVYLKSKHKGKRSTILLVGGLRRHKGINEFVKLATMLPQYLFELVVSANKEDINKYFIGTSLPSNLTIHTLQTDLHPFYRRAKILLQLSHTISCQSAIPWVETFGLTILEAISYGIPSLVPNEGGPIELIDDNINGFTINPLDLEDIKNKISVLMKDDNLYSKFSKNAFNKSKRFSKQEALKIIENYILL